MPLEPGHILGERYEIKTHLGGGGMGDVYEALDLKLSRSVALKVIKDDYDDPEAIPRFVLEWNILAQVRHDNVLTLHDVYDTPRLFFTAELLTGGTLADRLAQGAIAWHEAAKIGIQLSSALASVHERGIVHRDVKPQNVFLTESGRVKLLDFGIAKSLPMPTAEGVTEVRTGGGFCTPGFASPEQLARRDIDSRSDVFSFGILLHLMVAGTHPFDYAWPNILNNVPAPSLGALQAPFEFASVVQMCLHKDRDARYGTMADVEAALRHALAGPTAPMLSFSPIEEERDHDVALLAKFEAQLAEHNRFVLQQRSYAEFSVDFSLPRLPVLSRVRDFLASDKSFMTVTGKAGTGKSNLVARLSYAAPARTLVRLFDCGTMSWPWDEGLDRAILGLASGALTTDTLIRALNRTDHSLLIVFDGINESSRRLEFAERLTDFVHSINSPEIKILVTCRSPAWSIVRRHFGIPLVKQFHPGGVDGSAQLDLFDAVEAEDAYNLYQNAYRIQTPYAELAISVRHFLSHPLFLKLACEAFEGGSIPPVIALHEVFATYVRKCLGSTSTNSHEWTVVETIVLAMHEQARREIDVDLLRQDARIGSEMSGEEGSAYSHLLDEGLLTQSTRSESLLRSIDIVFITYERVFEFLLAEIVIGTVTAETIAQHLDLIRRRSFPQLRGALELALGFAITRGSADPSLLVELARIDRPDTRQFLSEVIQTVYESGQRRTAIHALNALARDSSLEAKLVAVHVAYKLNLDDRLVDLALSQNSVLRDRAALYLYARWNRYRLAGDLDGGYRPLYELRRQINILHVPKSRAALSTLVTLSLNLGLHVIDDPAALQPLIELLRELVRSIPGLAPDGRRGTVLGFASDKSATLVIELLSGVLSRVVIKDEVLAGLFDDHKSQRALLDVGGLITLDSLTGNEDKVLRWLTWKHPAVAFSFRTVLTRHVFLEPTAHLAMLESFLELPDVSIIVKINVAHSMIYGMVARLFSGQAIAAGTLQRLEGWVEQIWAEFLVDPSGPVPATEDHSLREMRSILFGLFLVDASQQVVSGRIVGSSFATRICQDVSSDPPRYFGLVLGALESMAYQGYIEYALATIIEPEFLATWRLQAPNAGYDVLANLRVVFQEEVDGMMQDNLESRSLWETVRARGGAPDPRDLWKTSYDVWLLVALAVNVSLLKLSGLLLLDLVTVSKSSDFLRRMMRTLIAVLFDPDRIDIAHIQFGLAHAPDWDKFDALEIPRNVALIKPEIHAYYCSLSTECVAKLGRGVMYGEL